MHSDFIEAFLPPPASLYRSKIPEPATRLLPPFLSSSFPLEISSRRGEIFLEEDEGGRKREKGRCTDRESYIRGRMTVPVARFRALKLFQRGGPSFYVHHKERHIAGVTGKRGASRCSFSRPRIEGSGDSGYTRGFRWLIALMRIYLVARARDDEKKNV